MELFSNELLTFFLIIGILLVLFSIYYEEEFVTNYDDKIIDINEKECEVNSKDFRKCINNNIIVQRRIRRELDNCKREKNDIMKKMIDRKKKKEIKFANGVLEESKEELKNIALKGVMDIKFKIKNDLIPANINNEIKYVKKILKIIENYDEIKIPQCDLDLVKDYFLFVRDTVDIM